MKTTSVEVKWNFDFHQSFSSLKDMKSYSRQNLNSNQLLICILSYLPCKFRHMSLNTTGATDHTRPSSRPADDPTFPRHTPLDTHPQRLLVPTSCLCNHSRSQHKHAWCLPRPFLRFRYSLPARRENTSWIHKSCTTLVPSSARTGN